MSDTRYFFVKVMKTAGGTLLQHIIANHERDEVYPYEQLDPDMHVANTRIDYLLGLPEERRRRIRVYTGHFPYLAAELLDPSLVTFTVLRDPVERTISYLKHCQRHHEQHRALPLEEIYEDRFYFETLIRDHQAKLFSMTVDDRLESYLDIIDVDAVRLARAKDNVEAVGLLGLQEHFGELLAATEARFGWRVGKVRNRNVGEPADIPAPFRRRIEDDNPADMALYEHARSLYERRRRAGAPA